MRSWWLIIIAGGAAAVLAGCGGSSGNAGTPSSSAAAPTTTSPARTATAETTPAPSTSPPATTPAATGPTICRAGDLSGSFLGGQGATGHGALGFALHNQSAHTCTTYGYPGIQFLSRAGQPLTTLPVHTTTDFFGTVSKRALTVAPGSTVSFRLGVTHGAASTAGCTTAYALQIIPPNDTGTLRISIANGAYECQTATVTPVQPGTSAYP